MPSPPKELSRRLPGSGPSAAVPLQGFFSSPAAFQMKNTGRPFKKRPHIPTSEVMIELGMLSFQNRQWRKNCEFFPECISPFRCPYQTFYLDFKMRHNGQTMKNYDCSRGHLIKTLRKKRDPEPFHCTPPPLPSSIRRKKPPRRDIGAVFGRNARERIP